MSNVIKIHSYTREKATDKDKPKKSPLLTDPKPQIRPHPKGLKAINQLSIKKDQEETKNGNQTDQKKKPSLTPSHSKTRTRHTINCTASPHNPRCLPSLQAKGQADLGKIEVLNRSKTPLRLKHNDNRSFTALSIKKQRMNITSNDFPSSDTSLHLSSNTKELQIILSLKKTIKEQNDELHEKMAEITALNKEKQATSNKELLIENQVLNTEIVKMKQLILSAGNNSHLSQQFDAMRSEAKMKLDALSDENDKLKKDIEEMKQQKGKDEEEKDKLREALKQQSDESKKNQAAIVLKDEENLKALKVIEEDYKQKLQSCKENYEGLLVNKQVEFDNKFIVQKDAFNCELNLKLEESNGVIQQLTLVNKEHEASIEDLNKHHKALKEKSDESETELLKAKRETATLNELIARVTAEKAKLEGERDGLVKQLEEEKNKPKEESVDEHNEAQAIEIPSLMSQEEISEISYLIRKTIQAFELTQEAIFEEVSNLPKENLIEALSKSLCSIFKCNSEKDYWPLVRYLFSLSLTDETKEISLPKLKKELLIALSTKTFKEIDEIKHLVQIKAKDILAYCQRGDYSNQGFITYEQLSQIIQLVYEKEENPKESIGKIKDYLVVQMKKCHSNEASLYSLHYSELLHMVSKPQEEAQPVFIEEAHPFPNQEGNGVLPAEKETGTTESIKDQMIFVEKKEPNLLIDDIQEKGIKQPTFEEIVSEIKKYLSDNQISFNSLLLSINSKVTVIEHMKWLSLADLSSLLQTHQISPSCDESSFDPSYLNEARDMLNLTTFSLLFSNDKDVNIELVEEVPTEEFNLISKERDDIILTSKFLDDVFAGALAREIEIRDQRDQKLVKAQEEANEDKKRAEEELNQQHNGKGRANPQSIEGVNSHPALFGDEVKEKGRNEFEDEEIEELVCENTVKELNNDLQITQVNKDNRELVVDQPKELTNDIAIQETANNFVSDLFSIAVQQKAVNEYSMENKEEEKKEEDKNIEPKIELEENGAKDLNDPVMIANGSPLCLQSDGNADQ